MESKLGNHATTAIQRILPNFPRITAPPFAGLLKSPTVCLRFVQESGLARKGRKAIGRLGGHASHQEWAHVTATARLCRGKKEGRKSGVKNRQETVNNCRPFFTLDFLPYLLRSDTRLSYV